MLYTPKKVKEEIKHIIDNNINKDVIKKIFNAQLNEEEYVYVCIGDSPELNDATRGYLLWRDYKIETVEHEIFGICQKIWI